MGTNIYQQMGTNILTMERLCGLQAAAGSSCQLHPLPAAAQPLLRRPLQRRRRGEARHERAARLRASGRRLALRRRLRRG